MIQAPCYSLCKLKRISFTLAAINTLTVNLISVNKITYYGELGQKPVRSRCKAIKTITDKMRHFGHWNVGLFFRRDTKPRTTTASDDSRVAAYKMSLLTLIPRQS